MVAYKVKGIDIQDPVSFELQEAKLQRKLGMTSVL